MKQYGNIRNGPRFYALNEFKFIIGFLNLRTKTRTMRISPVSVINQFLTKRTKRILIAGVIIIVIVIIYGPIIIVKSVVDLPNVQNILYVALNAATSVSVLTLFT